MVNLYIWYYALPSLSLFFKSDAFAEGAPPKIVDWLDGCAFLLICLTPDPSSELSIGPPNILEPAAAFAEFCFCSSAADLVCPTEPDPKISLEPPPGGLRTLECTK